MKTNTQKNRVAKRLLDTGKITRNECLRVYISRLSAIIQDLEEEGWVFNTEQVKGDYVYKLVKAPYTKVKYKLSDGSEITKTEKLTN